MRLRISVPGWWRRRKREAVLAELRRFRIVWRLDDGLPVVTLTGEDAYLIAKYGGYRPTDSPVVEPGLNLEWIG
jgi:hypothetical protein